MQNESQNIEYKKHSSYPRNHNIANVFYKAGFVESWGRGFKKIAEEFERACLPLPTIEENGGGVMAIIQRKTVDEVIAERDGNVGVNVGDFVGDFENDRKRFGGNAKSGCHKARR